MEVKVDELARLHDAIRTERDTLAARRASLEVSTRHAQIMVPQCLVQALVLSCQGHHSHNAQIAKGTHLEPSGNRNTESASTSLQDNVHRMEAALAEKAAQAATLRQRLGAQHPANEVRCSQKSTPYACSRRGCRPFATRFLSLLPGKPAKDQMHPTQDYSGATTLTSAEVKAVLVLCRWLSRAKQSLSRRRSWRPIACHSASPRSRITSSAICPKKVRRAQTRDMVPQTDIWTTQTDCNRIEHIADLCVCVLGTNTKRHALLRRC